MVKPRYIWLQRIMFPNYNVSFNPAVYYKVSPGKTYNIFVGDGGEGGIASTNAEYAGSKGDDSSFGSVSAEGGSGGQPSRVLVPNTDGYSNGGKGQTTNGRLIGGYGGNGVGSSGGQGSSYGGSGGGAGLMGFMGDGVAFCYGGPGGAPNTIATGTTMANVGKGGSGTGCATNSFAQGVKGGSGIVKIKYYV